VDEVVAAEFSCTQGPESSTQGGIITFSVQTDEEAVPVMGEVYRAFAASSELDSGWATNATFFPEGADTTDAQESFDDTGLGFSGAPRIYELRDHYDIHPTGTE
jgi:hypothetical protein